MINTKLEFTEVVNFLDRDGDGQIAYLELIPHLKRKPRDSSYTGNRVIGSDDDDSAAGKPESKRFPRVDEDIRRIKMKRELQDQRKRLNEERRKLKSARVRDKLRKKFGHIQKRERDDQSLSERIVKTGRAHTKYLREQRAQRLFKEAETAFSEWREPLKHVFLQFTEVSEGYSQNDTTSRVFERQRDQLTSMQENEWLLFLREFDIVPCMLSMEKAKQIFHSINASRDAHDSLTFTMFETALVKLIQTEISIVKVIDNFPDRVTAFMCYLRLLAMRTERELTLFPELGGYLETRSHRMGSNRLWEGKGAPMVDVVYRVPKLIQKHLKRSIVDVLEIVDDLLGALLGTPGHFLPPQQQSRPKHAKMDKSYGVAVVDNVLQAQQAEDSFFHAPLARQQAKEMVVALRRSKQSELQSRIVVENKILRQCMQMAETKEIAAARKNVKVLHLIPKKALREPDEKTKKTINRLYTVKKEKATEAQKKMRTRKKATFGSQSQRFGPFQSGNSKIAHLPEANIYNKGVLLELDEEKAFPGKAKQSSPKSFGYSALANVPLKVMGIGRFMVNMIGTIADACTDGKAKNALQKLYKMPKRGVPEDITFYENPKNQKNANGNKLVHLHFLEKKLKQKVTSSDKETSKYSLRKRQEERAYKELMEKKERIRLARKKQLEADLKIQREEKKKNDEAILKEKKKKEKQERLRAKKKAEDKKKYFEDKKAKIEEWKTQQANERKGLSDKEFRRQQLEKRKREADFEAMKSRRDHLEKDRFERILQEAEEYGIPLQETNYETYTKNIHNLDVVEKKIREAKTLVEQKKRNAEENAKYQADRRKTIEVMNAREEYEKKTIAELEAKLQSADMDLSDYVGEMMKVRLGIGGPSGGDHRAMKVSDFFGKIDEDSSGSLTKQELKESFEKLKIQLSDEQFESFYSAFDPNGDGKIDYMEFLAQMRTHVHGSEGIVKRESHIDRKKSKKGKKTSNDSRDGKKDEARDAEKSREKSS